MYFKVYKFVLRLVFWIEWPFSWMLGSVFIPSFFLLAPQLSVRGEKRVALRYLNIFKEFFVLNPILPNLPNVYTFIE